MRVKRFEDLDTWKKARELTKLIYNISSSGGFTKDWGLSDQIRRASVSVMSNIAEGFDSISKIEFGRFLNIARRSASEIQSQLYVALDQRYITENEFKNVYQDAEIIRKMITNFIKYLRGLKRTR